MRIAMRTRKTLRKTITLPGRYFTGMGQPETVMLKDLSTGGCRVQRGNRKSTLGAQVQLFVGGTGPHRAVIKWVEDGDVGLNFITPLTEQQFAALQSGEVGEVDELPETERFEDMGPLNPHRFC